MPNAFFDRNPNLDLAPSAHKASRSATVAEQPPPLRGRVIPASTVGFNLEWGAS